MAAVVVREARHAEFIERPVERFLRFVIGQYQLIRLNRSSAISDALQESPCWRNEAEGSDFSEGGVA